MIISRFNETLGPVAFRLSCDGLNSTQIAERLRILKPNGQPNEFKVRNMLHNVRAAERVVVMRMFRNGRDTYDIAKQLNMREALVCDLLHEARAAEKA